MRSWKDWRPRRQATPAPPPEDEATEEAYEDDEDQADAAEEEAPAEDDGVPWYSVRHPGGPDVDPDGPQTWTVAPGVQITVPAPQPPAQPSYSSYRRQLIRRWLLRHAAAAGVGWLFGLYQSMSAFLNSLGHGGAAAGLALAGFGWLFAEVITSRLGRFLPHRLLPAVHWAARVPMATALLVTALYAPQAHL